MDGHSVPATRIGALRSTIPAAPHEGLDPHPPGAASGVPLCRSEEMDGRLLRLHAADTCLVVCAPIPAHSPVWIARVHVLADRPLARGVTIAARDLARGDEVRRCGEVIGWVTRRVAAGTPLNMHELAGPPASTLH